MSDDQAYTEPWHSQNNLFKHFQGYLGIFTDIEAYSNTLRGAQLWGIGEASPILFENRKDCPYFRKKTLTESIFPLNFPFKINF